VGCEGVGVGLGLGVADGVGLALGVGVGVPGPEPLPPQPANSSRARTAVEAPIMSLVRAPRGERASIQSNPQSRTANTGKAAGGKVPLG